MELKINLDHIWNDESGTSLGRMIQEAIVEEIRTTTRREVKKVMDLHQTQVRSAVADVTKRMIANLDAETITQAAKLELVSLSERKKKVS